MVGLRTAIEMSILVIIGMHTLLHACERRIGIVWGGILLLVKWLASLCMQMPSIDMSIVLAGMHAYEISLKACI